MTNARQIRTVLKSKPVTEGAGVPLNRAFGDRELPLFDPFLMLDDFRSNDPADYRKGFPWHPHRGIETISYVLRGHIEHGDSMGNRGTISAGDVQWMTAGSGIVHQEMPEGDEDDWMCGFQLWANLPAAAKRMPPRYREVQSADIPEVVVDGGAQVRVICGAVAGTQGPVRDIVTDPQFLDVTLPPNSELVHPTEPGHTAFAYVIDGEGCFGGESEAAADSGSVVLFADGDHLSVSTREQPVRFLLMAGRPLGEPVAWGGPIVMNTQEELDLAFEEYRNGTFLKRGA